MSNGFSIWIQVVWDYDICINNILIDKVPPPRASGRLCVCMNIITSLFTEYDPYLEFDPSRWHMSSMEQGTFTHPDNLVPHPLQGAHKLMINLYIRLHAF